MTATADMIEILKQLVDFGGIGILAAVLFWTSERQRSGHAAERAEWKQIAQDGHRIAEQAVGAMASIQMLIEERIPRPDVQLAVIERAEL